MTADTAPHLQAAAPDGSTQLLPDGYDELLSSNVLIVTGKGGVGKTTVAATLALAAVASGRRTLLVEVEGRQGFSRTFGTQPWDYEEREFRPGPVGRGAGPGRRRLRVPRAVLRAQAHAVGHGEVQRHRLRHDRRPGPAGPAAGGQDLRDRGSAPCRRAADVRHDRARRPADGADRALPAGARGRHRDRAGRTDQAAGGPDQGDADLPGPHPGRAGDAAGGDAHPGDRRRRAPAAGRGRARRAGDRQPGRRAPGGRGGPRSAAGPRTRPGWRRPRRRPASSCPPPPRRS